METLKEDWILIILIPLILGIVVLVIEYWIIIPIRQVENYDDSLKSTRDWSTAIKKGIDRFKNYRSDNTFSSTKERVIIEATNIRQGRATLVLAVAPQWSLLFAISGISTVLHILGIFPRVIARYNVTIDRTGDILGIDSVIVREGEKQRSPVPNRANQNNNQVQLFISFLTVLACSILFLSRLDLLALFAVFLATVFFISFIPLGKFIKSVLGVWLLVSEIIVGIYLIEALNTNQSLFDQFIENSPFISRDLGNDETLFLPTPTKPLTIITENLQPTITTTTNSVIATIPPQVTSTSTPLPEPTSPQLADQQCIVNNANSNSDSIDINVISDDVSVSVDGVCQNLSTINITNTSGDVHLSLRGIFPNLYSIIINSASSDLNISLLGEFPNLSTINIDSISGSKFIDASGIFGAHVNANLQTSSGDFTIVLSDRVSANIFFSTASGEFKNGQGIMQEGGSYSFSTVGSTESIMDIRVNTISGDLEIR